MDKEKSDLELMLGYAPKACGMEGTIVSECLSVFHSSLCYFELFDLVKGLWNRRNNRR